MKRRLLLFFTMLFTLSLITMIPIKAEAKVCLSDSKVVLEPTTTYQLNVEGTESDVKWSSSNKNVVTVDENGLLTPKAVGMSKVVATVNGKKYSCKVTVVDYTGMSIEQKEVVSLAVKYVGNKYCYGGSSLTKGTDCSGFTMALYKKLGYKLKHNAYAQMKTTKRVSMSEIQPGDLIFYGTSKSNCSHVALYIGNKKVVHASNEITGITVSDYKYRKYVAVGRVLETETYLQEVDGNVTRTAVAQ